MNRTNRKSVRLSDDELLKVKNKAHHLNISISEYIRRSCIDGYSEKVDKKNYYKDKLFQINKIGNNLNQIAYYVNSNKSLDILVLQKLVSIEKKLNTILQDAC